MKLRKLFLSFLIIVSFMNPVYAGSATISGEGYTVTTRATTSYISCTATGTMANGSSAEVTGWAQGTNGPVKIGSRTSNTSVSWYISSGSGYSAWAYAKGRARLSDGVWYSTTAAYAN